jgi:hypothetical protein
MQKQESYSGDDEKVLAAVCGLYCEACTLFIATKEDPARLKKLSERFHLSEEEMKCYGCRSDKRGPYCQKCKMISCVAERGVEFCSECEEYPCNELKQFQSERPHRIELWDDLMRIRDVGYKYWLTEIKENYVCSECQTINSAYDIKCRKCGSEPSCKYVANHKEAIEQVLKGL